MAENLTSSYLTRTPDTPTDTKKYTLSVWLKAFNHNTGDYNYVISSDAGGASREHITFEDALEPFFKWYHRHSDNTVANLSTQAVYRDESGWYHLVVCFDSAQSTAADRVKIYINGSRITHFRTETHIVQNTDSNVNSSNQGPKIGMIGQGTGSAQDGAWNGLMSHFHFCDGYAYDASAFGEEDATTGAWKIKTSPSVSYGANGYFIFKDSANLSGSTVQDQSGNSNDWTVSNGTITNTKDSPSNNYSTLNPLHHNKENLSNGTIEYRNGNTSFKATNTGGNAVVLSTLAVDKGKFYAEAKLTAIGGAYPGCGILATNQGSHIYGSNNYVGKFSNGWHYGTAGSSTSLLNSDSWTSYGDSYTSGDYIGIALDMDNNKLYFSKNGTWQNSGTGISITAGKTYHFGCNGNNDCIWDWNFGNGVFGETALTGTTYTGADGNGIFKYDPNSITLDSTTKSFKSLSTGGINT